MLGGGGSRGAYEAGVWQALTELGIEIDIVTGTSVGATTPPWSYRVTSI